MGAAALCEGGRELLGMMRVAARALGVRCAFAINGSRSRVQEAAACPPSFCEYTCRVGGKHLGQA